MSTTAIAARSAGLTRSRRIVLGFALFSIAGTGVVTLAPAIAAQQGSGGQPSFEVIAATGAALILLAGLFLGYVGRVLGLGRAWLLMAIVSNGSLLVYRFVVVPVSMYKTTFDLPDRALFAYAIATVAVSDVAAWTAGRRFGTARLPLSGSSKTYAGSAAFFVATLVIGAVLLPRLSHGVSPALLLAAPVALAATLVEALSRRGLDNLLVSPLTAAFLWALQVAGAFA
jgi:dolichol kinase